MMFTKLMLKENRFEKPKHGDKDQVTIYTVGCDGFSGVEVSYIRLPLLSSAPDAKKIFIGG